MNIVEKSGVLAGTMLILSLGLAYVMWYKSQYAVYTLAVFAGGFYLNILAKAWDNRKIGNSKEATE